MKILLFAIACLLSAALAAQSTISKSFPVKAGQPVTLKFDYPVVRVSTWDKNEVSVIASVNINDHENDSAFALSATTEGGGLVVTDEIRNAGKLPHHYTIVHGGKKTIYHSADEYRKAKTENDERSYEGTEIDIVLEIKVPAESHIEIKAVYGIVELIDFHAAADVDATYGGIDATITPSSTGRLKATTSYGQIYSNLDLKITDHAERDFFSSISAEPGTGPSFSLTSTYGKIYLRRP